MSEAPSLCAGGIDHSFSKRVPKTDSVRREGWLRRDRVEMRHDIQMSTSSTDRGTRISAEGRLGISLKDLRPVDAIAHCRSPVLIISGTLDRHTTVNDTKALFASAHEPKELWLVSGAAHVDLYGFANEEYRRRILKFFSRHLGSARSMSASIGLPVSSARSLAEYCHVVRGKGDHDQSINPQAAVRRPPGVRGTRVEAGGSRIPPNLAPSTGLLQTRSAQVMRARWACPPSRQTSSSVELWRLGPQSLRMRQPHSVRTQAGRSRSLPRPAG